MRRSTKQLGFSTVEVAVIVVILLALGGVGYWIFARQSAKNNANSASLSQGESVDAPAAPDLNTASDLDTVDNALNELNLEAGNSDNAALDSQSSAF